jgi:hypothetical protein
MAASQATDLSADHQRLAALHVLHMAVNYTQQNSHRLKTSITALKFIINRVSGINLLGINCKLAFIYGKPVNCKSFLGRGQWWGNGSWGGVG